jgi:hypothetical protein
MRTHADADADPQLWFKQGSNDPYSWDI